MRMPSTIARAVLLAMSLLGAAAARGKNVVPMSVNGNFVADAVYGGDPFHPTIGPFTLRGPDGRALWTDQHFDQSDCWIANDGRTVVGLKSSGDEGLPGILTFYGPRGDILDSRPVVDFSGGGFTADGNLFICRTRELGIAAYDRTGHLQWRVPAGSRYFPSRDGVWLAVVRSERLDIHRDGVAAGSVSLGGPLVSDARFADDGATLAVTARGLTMAYDLGSLRLLSQREQPAVRPMAPGRARRLRTLGTASWPLDPTDSTHAIGNGWGEYQWYGGDPYFHPGIDVMALDPSGVPVYAVAHGWVKAWLSTGGTWYWRFAIADTSSDFADSCDGWLYAHIDANRAHAAVGDEVWPGDQIGYLVQWPVTGFDHCHFARIRDAGAVWGNAGADWVFQDDPLNSLTPSADTAAPVIEPALAGSRFAFCRNNTGSYLPPGALNGDVDIMARIYDRCGRPIPGYTEWQKLNPFKVEYAIHGPGGSVPRTTSFLFSHFLAWDDTGLVNTVFKQDDSCVTYGDYDSRQYYYIVTNTDGDSALDAGDTSGCWRTADFPDGHYWVVVYASDQAGTTTADSQLVGVNNYGGVSQPAAAMVPAIRTLAPAFPNPFSVSTTIVYQLELGGPATLQVYNIQGQAVRTLTSGPQAAGRHAAPWNGRNDHGQRLAPGVYVVRLVAAGATRTARVMLIK